MLHVGQGDIKGNTCSLCCHGDHNSVWKSPIEEVGLSKKKKRKDESKSSSSLKQQKTVIALKKEAAGMVKWVCLVVLVQRARITMNYCCRPASCPYQGTLQNIYLITYLLIKVMDSNQIF